MEDLVLLIQWPTTRKVMIEQLRVALKMYSGYDVTNRELLLFVENYMNNFANLLFSNDYEVHPSIKKALGKRNSQVLECVVKTVRQNEWERSTTEQRVIFGKTPPPRRRRRFF